MTDAARKQVDGKSKVAPRIGRYVGNAGINALVDLGDQRVPVQFATPWVPSVNEPVWVDSIDGVLRLTGPTTPKPGVGVILTITGTIALVRTDFGDFSMPAAPSDPMPTSGDTVGISWSSQPWCTLLVDVPDPGAPPPNPGGGGGQVMSAEFRAVDAGTTHSNGDWWQAEVWAAENNVGAWMYGTAIKDTIPASAAFVSLEIYVNYNQRYGNSPNWALHNLASKSGVPSFGGSTPWAPGEGWQTPPDAAGWFNALKAGGSHWGVGVNHGGFNKFASRTQDGATGALRIKWR